MHLGLIEVAQGRAGVSWVVETVLKCILPGLSVHDNVAARLRRTV